MVITHYSNQQRSKSQQNPCQIRPPEKIGNNVVSHFVTGHPVQLSRPNSSERKCKGVGQELPRSRQTGTQSKSVPRGLPLHLPRPKPVRIPPNNIFLLLRGRPATATAEISGGNLEIISRGSYTNTLLCYCCCLLFLTFSVWLMTYYTCLLRRCPHDYSDLVNGFLAEILPLETAKLPPTTII